MSFCDQQISSWRSTDAELIIQAKRRQDRFRLVVFSIPTALPNLHYVSPIDLYQSIRRSPATMSKCWSLLKIGSLYWRQSAAIQTSLAGIGVPAFLSSVRSMA